MLRSRPTIFPCIPTPIYIENFNTQKWAIKAISGFFSKIAINAGLDRENIIDLYHPFGGDQLSKPFLFYDGNHCNENGYLYLA
jgi:hypothetical protein